MTSANSWDRAAAILAIVNFAAATAHGLDNVVHFDAYAEPDWITGPNVFDALYWIAVVLLAVGFNAFRRRLRVSAAALIGFVSISRLWWRRSLARAPSR